MNQEELDWHAAKVLTLFRQINALVLASIQAARDERDHLDEQIDTEEAEPVVRSLSKLASRLDRWLERAKFLRAWLLEKGHEIGVKVEKARMGALDHGSEHVRRLRQELHEKHFEVAKKFLELAGRDIYQRALQIADELLAGEIEETAEWEQFREDLQLDEFEAVLEDEADGQAFSESDGSETVAGAGAGVDGSDGGVLDEDIRNGGPDPEDLEEMSADGAHDPL